MNNQTPEQFIATMQQLADQSIRTKPEFVFMVALRNRLLENHFGHDDAARLASRHILPLPVGSTTEQLTDMAYHFANLIANCHDDLERQGFSGPSDEAALLAEQLVRAALV